MQEASGLKKPAAKSASSGPSSGEDFPRKKPTTVSSPSTSHQQRNHRRRFGDGDSDGVGVGGAAATGAGGGGGLVVVGGGGVSADRGGVSATTAAGPGSSPLRRRRQFFKSTLADVGHHHQQQRPRPADNNGRCAAVLQRSSSNAMTLPAFPSVSSLSSASPPDHQHHQQLVQQHQHQQEQQQQLQHDQHQQQQQLHQQHSQSQPQLHQQQQHLQQNHLQQQPQLMPAHRVNSQDYESPQQHLLQPLQFHDNQQQNANQNNQLRPPRSDDRSPLRSSLIKEGRRRSPSCKKTVSFSSMPTERKISNVQDCLIYMQSGCELIKVRSSTRRYRRRFTLDADCTHLRWTPTNKKPHKAKISIDAVKEVRLGRNTENLRNSDSCFEELTEDCAFSVIWGDVYQSLDLIANTADEANIWVTGLMALTSGSVPILQHAKALNCGTLTLRDRWLENEFRRSFDEENSNKVLLPATIEQQTSFESSLYLLNENSVIKLIKRINPRIPANRVRLKLKECDSNKPDECKGLVSCDEFCELYKEMATRPDIYFLMVRYANKDYLTSDDLQLFLETEQGMVGVTKELCQSIIERNEPSELGRQQSSMTVDGFTAFLQSQDCELIDPTHYFVCQDMSQPLNHYFISSSFNSYLQDDQLKGSTSADGFIRTLKWGCRYIEMDVWESDECDEPVVCHCQSVAEKLPLSKALRAIKDYAFEYSQYPLLIHLKNHLEVEKQKVLAAMLVETLGDYLLVGELPDVDPMFCLPSPEQLKKKILLTGKKLRGNNNGLEMGEVSEEDETEATTRSGRPLKKSTPSKKRLLCRDLSELISPYLISTTFRDLQKAVSEQEPNEVCSLNESTALRLAAQITDAFVVYTRRFLTRVYPNGVRVDSSNYNPQEFWNCGCQIASLNVQTAGLMMDLVKGKFSANGCCGYVLKPTVMRDEQAFFSPRDCLPTATPQTLHLKLISAHSLPRPRGSTAKGDSLDPFVIVEIFGVPSDCAEERTKTVRNDAFNPVFDESFQFDISVPELTLIRFLVLDDDYIGDDFIGQYTIPFECLQSGYRHVTLLNCDGDPMDGVTLFLHVAVTNKRGGGKAKRRGMSVRRKQSKVHTGIKLLGVKALDEMFKTAIPIVADCVSMRTSLENALSRWQESCGIGPATSVRQGLRLMHARLQAVPQATGSAVPNDGTVVGVNQLGYSMEVWMEDGYPCIGLRGNSVPEVLRKSCEYFERVLSACRAVTERSDGLASKLEDIHRRLSESYDELLAGFGGESAPNPAYSLRGKRATRASENFAWNLRLVKTQLDMMGKLQHESRDYIKQVQDTACVLGILREQCQQPCAHRSQMQPNAI